MKKLIALILSASFIFLCLVSCSGETAHEEGYYTRTQRDEMGRLSISLSRTTIENEYLEDEELKSIYNEALDVFEDAYCFIFADYSEGAIKDINAAVNTVFDIDPLLLEEISAAIQLSEICDGMYDPSYGALTSLLKKSSTAEAAEIEEALSHTGCDKIEIGDTTLKKADSALMIDLYALADGYAIGKVIDFLKDSPVAYGTVTYDGIAGVFGTKPDGEPFLVDIGDGTENGRDGSFKITEGYVALTSKSFGQTFDLTDGVLDHSIEKAAVYSKDPKIAAVLSSIAYSYGSDALLSLYEKDELSFEAVLTEKDGSKVFTDNAESGDLYTEETVPEEGSSAK